MSLNVAKFGGTSVADYSAMSRCADIIINNPNTRVVVVSASSGVTNLLVELTQEQTTNERRSQLIKDISHIQYQILDELGNPQEVAARLDAVLSRISTLSESLSGNRTKATLLALGQQVIDRKSVV